MGRFEMVLKRAWPCSSRLVPVEAPIGFSAALSSVGARVFSAQFLSDAVRWRPSKTSEIGLLRGSAFRLFSAIQFPTPALMIEEEVPGCKRRNRPSGWWNSRSKFYPQETPRATWEDRRALHACFPRHRCLVFILSEGSSEIEAGTDGVGC